MKAATRGNSRAPVYVPLSLSISLSHSLSYSVDSSRSRLGEGDSPAMPSFLRSPPEPVVGGCGDFRGRGR